MIVGTDGATGRAFVALECFAEGTRIRTDRGDVPVEALRCGDLAWSALQERFEPIAWIGHRRVDCARHPNPRSAWPVPVAAGALGPERPERDLYLSRDHAIYVMGALVPIRCLINKTTIAEVPRDAVDYYHVELRQHGVLLADGLPAESYLDIGDRPNFSNRSGVVALHPQFINLRWELDGCARLMVTGPEVTAARALVKAQAEGMRQVA